MFGQRMNGPKCYACILTLNIFELFVISKHYFSGKYNFPSECSGSIWVVNGKVIITLLVHQLLYSGQSIWVCLHNTFGHDDFTNIKQ